MEECEDFSSGDGIVCRSYTERLAGKPVQCPHCGCRELRFVWGVGNTFRFVTSFFLAGFLVALMITLLPLLH